MNTTTTPTASGALPGQSHVRYILKATDCFGDTWPMSPFQGIDGLSFDDQDAGLAHLQQRKITQEGRRGMRLSGGWEPNTIRSFSVHSIELLS